MPGKTKRQAVEAYAKPLRQIVACITEDTLICHAKYELTPQHDPSVLTFSKGPARIAGTDLTLYFLQHFKVIPFGEKEWKVRTLKYVYAIETSTTAEVIAFHWDSGQRDVHYAHSHVELPHVSKKCHIPTGRVPFEDVVWFLIKDLKATPRTKKWERVISETREKFMLHKTW